MITKRMAFASSRSVRFRDDIELAQATICSSGCPTKPKNRDEGRYGRHSGSKIFPEKPSKCFKEKVLSRVFSEEFDSLLNNDKKSFDPHGHPIHRWNKVFLIACLVSLFVDPLFFFLLCVWYLQSYLQSTIVRLEEWRIKRTDMEQWMHHRQLPLELKQCVRRYYQYKWVATQGVDEEALLKGLPLDLRRDIKRHLCLDLVRRVPLLDEMDEQMLEAICERLRPALYTEGTCVVREMDPVGETLFVIRGHLDSCTTQGGRSGFFNSCRLGPGEFCGEELLPWALDPRPNSPSPAASASAAAAAAAAVPGRGRRARAGLPTSTRTVRAVSDVEAFALAAEDLKEVAAQFRRLHSREMRHKLRFYSHQWRAWAACFIQAAWRSRGRRRASMEIRVSSEDTETKMEKQRRWRIREREREMSRVGAMDENSPKKPTKPDFSLK